MTRFAEIEIIIWENDTDSQHTCLEKFKVLTKKEAIELLDRREFKEGDKIGGINENSN
jgi:hypothetical protein